MSLSPAIPSSTALALLFPLGACAALQGPHSPRPTPLALGPMPHAPCLMPSLHVDVHLCPPETGSLGEPERRRHNNLQNYFYVTLGGGYFLKQRFFKNVVYISFFSYT